MFWGSAYQSFIFIPKTYEFLQHQQTVSSLMTRPPVALAHSLKGTPNRGGLSTCNKWTHSITLPLQIHTYIILCSNSYGLLDPGISETEELMYVQNTGDGDLGTCKEVDLTASGAPWKMFILPLCQTLYASCLDRPLIASNALCPYFFWWCMDLVRLLLGWGENPQYFLSPPQDVLCQWKTSYWVIE